jgi:hypothetical protein
MQLRDWLKSYFSSTYYWYADDCEWPVGRVPEALGQALSAGGITSTEHRTSPASPTLDHETRAR